MEAHILILKVKMTLFTAFFEGIYAFLGGMYAFLRGMLACPPKGALDLRIPPGH